MKRHDLRTGTIWEGAVGANGVTLWVTRRPGLEPRSAAATPNRHRRRLLVSTTRPPGRRPPHVVSFTCATCGSVTTRAQKPSRSIPRFCSHKCYGASMLGVEPIGWARTPDRCGADHHGWKGDQVSRKGGRKRALKLFSARPCEACGATRAERHHKDDNTANNDPTNIQFLCRRCHMTVDGRIPA